MHDSVQKESYSSENMIPFNPQTAFLEFMLRNVVKSLIVWKVNPLLVSLKLELLAEFLSLQAVHQLAKVS